MGAIEGFGAALGKAFALAMIQALIAAIIIGIAIFLIILNIIAIVNRRIFTMLFFGVISAILLSYLARDFNLGVAMASALLGAILYTYAMKNETLRRYLE